MKKVVLLTIISVLIVGIFFMIKIDTANAAYNGSGAPAYGAGALGGSCSWYSGFLFCGNAVTTQNSVNDFLGLRLSLIYYNNGGATEVIGTRNILHHHQGAYGYSAPFNCDNNNNCTLIPSWFTTGYNNFGYNYTQIKNDLVGADGKNKDSLNYWLQTLFGVNRTSLTKESCKTNGSGNCMWKSGYRILIEPLVSYGYGGQFYFDTLKKAANLYSWDQNPMTVWDRFGNLLHTNFNDIGIYAATCSGRGGCYNCLRDWGQGCGYNIVDISDSIDQIPDYTIDAACTNCSSTVSKDNRAYIIQDIPKWEDIVKSSSLTGANKIYTYYTSRVPGYFCREEYHIMFPDANSIVKVETGRFFGVNEDPKDTVFPSRTPNFAPLKVDRIIQCKPISGSGDVSVVSGKYANSSAMNLTLKYVENKANFKQGATESYDTTESLVANKTERTVTSSGGIITYKISSFYKLKWDVYRYIRLSDGKSIQSTFLNSEATLTSDFKNKHYDMLSPNLPISFNNERTETSKKAADITLTFDFPSDSSMKQSFTSANDYLKLTGSGENVYKKISSGTATADERNTSACYKLYGGTGTNFNTCVSQRTSNKIGTGANSCYTINSGNYVCPVEFKEINDACNPKIEICCESGVTPCPDGTCPVSGSCSGTCVDGSDPVNGYCPVVCEFGVCDIGDLIYRPIDLTTPFPAQSGSGRKTGANWCAYNVATKKITCSNINEIAKYHIQNNRKSANENVYKKTPLYSFELDYDELKAIKSYNQNTEYDDESLNCANGYCYSTFLRGEDGKGTPAGGFSGLCASKSNLITCAESGS